VTDPKIVTFANEVPGLQAVADGKIDAFLCSQPVGAGAIADGKPLRQLDKVAFFTQKTGYVDRGLTLAPGPFLDRVDAVIRDLHSQGKLKALSIQFFKTDYATPAAAFNSRRSTRRFRRAPPGLADGVMATRISRPWRRSLRSRLVAYFVLLSAVTILAVGGVVYVRATTT